MSSDDIYVKITVTHTYSEIHTKDKVSFLYVRNLLQPVVSWVVKNYNPKDPAKSTYRRSWVLSEYTRKFPTGLLGLVIEILTKNGIVPDIEDKREYPDVSEVVISEDLLEGVTLRDYQIEAVQAAVFNRRGVIRMIMGSGKTECMIALIKALNMYPVIWLTHTKDLLTQTAERFRNRFGDLGLTIGELGGGTKELGDVTVCTVQTLASLKKSKKFASSGVKSLLADAQVLVIDEAHHAASRSFYTIAMECQAPFRFGISATPLDRKDGSNLKLIGVVGDVIYDYTAKQAAEDGVLSIPEIIFLKFEKISGDLLPDGKDWIPLYRTGIVENDDRNEAVFRACEKCVEEDRATLILVNRIDHGKELDARIRDRFGDNSICRFIWSKDSAEKRSKAVKDLESGSLKVLVSSSIFDEGIDAPFIDAVIVACAGKSTIKDIQRVGRGMRKGGKDLVVYDFWDTHHRVLLRHSQKRKKDYASLEVGKITVKDL